MGVACLFSYFFYRSTKSAIERRDEIMLSRFEAIFTTEEGGKWREKKKGLSLLFQVAFLLFLDSRKRCICEKNKIKNLFGS